MTLPRPHLSIRRILLAFVCGEILAFVTMLYLMWPIAGVVYDTFKFFFGDDLGNRRIVHGLQVFLVATPTLVLVALIAGWRRPADASESRCRRCSYILRGLAEPRCSECGERI